jgi:DNA polymerase-3 subunit beta
MKIHINNPKDFAKSLKQLSKATDGHCMPILGNVLLHAELDGPVWAMGTDLYTSCKVRVHGVSMFSGETTVSLKALAGAVKGMSKAKAITLETCAQGLMVSSDLGAATFPTIDPAEFPAMPWVTPTPMYEMVCSIAELRGMIEATIHAVSDDFTRLHLSSLLLEVGASSFRCVATDGHRLAKVESALFDRDANGKKTQWLIPKQSARALLDMLAGIDGDCKFCTAGPNLFAYLPDGEIWSCKLVDAQFPPYEQVIPQLHENEAECLVNTGLFGKAAGACKATAPKRTGGIKIVLGANMINLSSEDPDKGESHASCPVQYTGAPKVLGLNIVYLSEALTMHPGDCRVQFGGELDPIVMRSPGRVSVIMPMRI